MRWRIQEQMVLFSLVADYRSFFHHLLHPRSREKIVRTVWLLLWREGERGSKVGNNLTSQEEEGVVAERASWSGGGWGGAHLDGEAAIDMVSGSLSI
jgi:hypothetical protein